MNITVEQDTRIRRYAKWLDADNGEDAYHDAVVACIQRKVKPDDAIGLLSTSTKYSLYKIYRHEQAEKKCVDMFLSNTAIPRHTALAQQRKIRNVKQTYCNKGHELTPENRAPCGTRTTCRICRRARRRKDHRLCI